MKTHAPLSLYAGKKAIAHIKQSGLSANDIRIIAGAAGGPKWLVLHGLDKYIFGDFLAEVEKPVHLLGSSIGAWRYAAYCRKDFHKAFALFEKDYFSQRYSANADLEEVTRVLDDILEGILADGGAEEILANKRFRLNLFADRGLGLLQSDQSLLLGTGLLLCIAMNMVSRNSLSLCFRRTLFHHPETPPFINMDDFPTDKVQLDATNLRRAILASGSIPMVVKGIDNIPGARPGAYRDGGLIDYHMSLPYGIDEGIILQPHFSKKVIPGWFDKFPGWRKPKPEYLERVLLLAPSDSFIEQLPYSKIPDRKDFAKFGSDDESRTSYWREVTRRSEELANTLQSWITEGSLLDHIKPFE